MIAVSTRKTSVIHSTLSFGGWMAMKMMSAMPSTDSTANSRYSGMPMSHGPIVGHFGVPMAKKPSAIGTVKDRNRKISVAVHHDGVDVGAADRDGLRQPDEQDLEDGAGPDRRHRRAESATDRGQRLGADGRPPSRENAKIMRDAEVTVARPHRNWAIRMTR